MSAKHVEHQFENGLVLLIEPMLDVASVSMYLLVPAGVAYDPPERLGLANLVSQWVGRGAGDYDSRGLVMELDRLGVNRDETASLYHLRIGASMVGTKLEAALPIFADMVRRPRLDSDHFEAIRSTALQEISGLEDDPWSLLSKALRHQTCGEPLGRHKLGERDHVLAATVDEGRAWFSHHFHANGAILALAGAVDPEATIQQVGRLLVDWKPGETAIPTSAPYRTSHGHRFLDKVQTILGVAFPSVPYSDEDFFNAQGVVGVLSGGSSARLFTEVREKRGLCYAVSASYLPLRDAGYIVASAGTTNERAQETMDVLLAELERLREGIATEEVERLKVGLHASLVMGEESSANRAVSLASSYFHLGHVRTVEEIAEHIDRITPLSILEYLERHPVGNYVSMVLGPQPLEIHRS